MFVCEGTVLFVTQVTAGSVRPGTRTPCSSPPQSAPVQSPASKRFRKDRGPNWLPQEVTALVNAKRDLFLKEIDTVDGRDLMTHDSTKSQRVSQEVMKCGFSPCPRGGAAYKTKWNQIIPEYKRIADFFARTGRNGADYWDLTSTERKSEGLPCSFPQELFHNIHEWFGSRPSMQPPHTRDLLSHEDGYYRSQVRIIVDEEEVQDSDPIT